uniref:Hexosyltransferase n=1 Tax=Araucaria cunninghamii TaxID=56994 RepID=A0A0D6QWV9_ARACU
MKRKNCAWLVVAVLVYLVFVAEGARSSEGGIKIQVPHSQRTAEAYVTLLYGDEFLLGVRVLGKSIRKTGTTKDMVVLVSDGVSSYAVQLLQADGWIVEHIRLLANPNQKRPKRFWGVYTKLKIFNMTNYKKVVYLDADTVVLRSIEDLFKCRKFCANLKHSERLNSGVMVVEPSESLFNDMMTKVNTLPSYTGGDQGFLNSYYADFPNAHLFEPNLSEDQLKSRSDTSMERLSTLYNADVGLYMLANKWMVDGNELRVVHYTLGPLKPWDWWTAWLLKPVDLWQDVRVTLEGSLPGTAGGKDSHTQLVVKILFVLPLLVALFYGRHFLIQVQQGLLCNGSFCGYARHLYYKYKSGSSLPIYSAVAVSTSTGSNLQYSNGLGGMSNIQKLPAYLGVLSVFVCFLSAAVSVGLAVFLVPRQVMPWTGLLLVYEWSFFVFMVLFGKYLDVINAWGRAYGSGSFGGGGSDSSQYDSGKGHRHASTCDAATFYYGLGMAFLSILAPSLPFFFGVTALFLRLGMMIGGALILVAYMTYTSEHLAIRSFLKGREERSPPPSSYLCC